MTPAYHCGSQTFQLSYLVKYLVQFSMPLTWLGFSLSQKKVHCPVSTTEYRQRLAISDIPLISSDKWWTTLAGWGCKGTGRKESAYSLFSHLLLFLPVYHKLQEFFNLFHIWTTRNFQWRCRPLQPFCKLKSLLGRKRKAKSYILSDCVRWTGRMQTARPQSPLLQRARQQVYNTCLILHLLTQGLRSLGKDTVPLIPTYM